MHAHVTYDGTTLRLTLTDTVTNADFTTSGAINIPTTVGGSTAYARFTGGTSSNSSIQKILSSTYTANGRLLFRQVAPLTGRQRSPAIRPRRLQPAAASRRLNRPRWNYGPSPRRHGGEPRVR